VGGEGETVKEARKGAEGLSNGRVAASAIKELQAEKEKADGKMSVTDQRLFVTQKLKEGGYTGNIKDIIGDIVPDQKTKNLIKVEEGDPSKPGYRREVLIDQDDPSEPVYTGKPRQEFRPASSRDGDTSAKADKAWDTLYGMNLIAIQKNPKTKSWSIDRQVKEATRITNDAKGTQKGAPVQERQPSSNVDPAQFFRE